MNKGEIVLIPFPFTGLSGSKIRPAIVLYSNSLDVTVCFVTSEMKWKESFDFVVPPDETNGLKNLSLVRSGKIATIDKDLILGKLGELSPLHIQELNRSLLELFQLPGSGSL